VGEESGAAERRLASPRAVVGGSGTRGGAAAGAAGAPGGAVGVPEGRWDTLWHQMKRRGQQEHRHASRRRRGTAENWRCAGDRWEKFMVKDIWIRLQAKYCKAIGEVNFRHAYGPEDGNVRVISLEDNILTFHDPMGRKDSVDKVIWHDSTDHRLRFMFIADGGSTEGIEPKRPPPRQRAASPPSHDSTSRAI
jgi:hypothetical protein